jgi:monoamine oxidase
MSTTVLDVAIVGGGVSGIYAAWRLLTTGGKERVAVFEADNHIGGRLLSVTPPGIPNMKAELGGMRILPAVQPLIKTLIHQLNAEAGAADRIETYPFPVDQPENIAYLRGIYLRLKEFQTPSRVPYHLDFLEAGKTAGALVVDAIGQLIPGITDKDLTDAQRREMARTAKFDGVPLYKQGFWQALMRVMSGEAYQLAIAAGGYQSTLTSWNAADAIPWYLSDFGVAPKYEGFRRGFQQVPLTLQARVEKAGGRVQCNARITGFDYRDGLITLHFAQGPSVTAKALILAMPRRALELIQPQSQVLQQEAVQTLIRSVTPRPLFKIFTTYAHPWWLAAGVEAGRTTTDLPVRQTYYWPKDDGQPAKQGRAMLMASYDDGLNIGFWDSFRPKRGVAWLQEGVSSPSADRPEQQAAAHLGLKMFHNATANQDPEADPWQRYLAPEAMVEEIQRQLATIHGLPFVPKVLDASFRDWGDDPFGGGWNSWNIGVESWHVKEKILQPDPSAPVYICGEAYSDAQGWVEGALQTADALLKKHFHIHALA